MEKIDNNTDNSSSNVKEKSLVNLPVLSKRLQAVADMVDKGSKIADVGTDHGFVPIYLVGSGKVNQAIAMDVRKGPLDRARQNVAEYGLEDKIMLRLSDGLEKLSQGEADEMICAGMGGPLMVKILEEGNPREKRLKYLILEPQSDILCFRKYLRKNGYSIISEKFIEEDGKYYPVIKAECSDLSCKENLSEIYEKAADFLMTNLQKNGRETSFEQAVRICDRFGPCIIMYSCTRKDEGKRSDLYRFLMHSNRVCDTILYKIKDTTTTEKMLRIKEINEEKSDIEAILSLL